MGIDPGTMPYFQCLPQQSLRLALSIEMIASRIGSLFAAICCFFCVSRIGFRAGDDHEDEEVIWNFELERNTSRCRKVTRRSS
jgi:hypothetical protein